MGLAVGLAVALSSGGSSSSADVPDRGTLVNALPGAADVQRLFRGIPQRSNALGAAQAPVTMIEYIDLQCPYCRAFETEVLPVLVSRYIRPGKVKLVMRPIAFIGPDSERGQLATIAAGEQNRMFNFAQILYHNQGSENTGWLSDDMVKQTAASIPGLDVPGLLSARDSEAVKSAATAFNSAGVTQTPTILVGKSGQEPEEVELSSASDAQSVIAAIQNALG
jgi:protein-disulfide isomerase